MKIDVGHSLGRPRVVVLLSLLPRGEQKSETMQINGNKGGEIRAALLLAPHTCSQSPWLKRKKRDCSHFTLQAHNVKYSPPPIG